MDNKNQNNFISEEEVEKLESAGKIASVQNPTPIIPSEVNSQAANQTPQAERYISGSIAPALQYQPDLLQTQYPQGSPTARVMPVSPAGLPSNNAAIESIIKQTVGNVTLTMPKEYSVAQNNGSIAVTWVPENASTALMGPVPTATTTGGTPYINFGYSNNSFGALTPSFPTWGAAQNYTVSNLVTTTSGRIIDSNGNIQTVVTGGLSGLTHPAWMTTYGALTTDNTVVWRCDGIANIISKGDTLFFLESDFNESVSSLTDTMGNTWAPATTAVAQTDYLNGKTVTLRGWYAVANGNLANGASYTLTIHATGGGGAVLGYCCLAFISGMSATPLAGLQSGNTENLPGATPNPYGPGNIVTTQQQLLLNLIFADNTMAGTAAGWGTAAGTPGAGAFNTGLMYLVGAAGSYNPQTLGNAGAVSTAQSIIVALNIASATTLVSTPGIPSFRDIVNLDLSTAVFGPSGPNHAPGAVPDPGPVVGTTKVLLENATWGTVPVVVDVNGSPIAGSLPNLNGTTPAAPGGSQNVTFQKDSTTPATNVSAYIPAYGLVSVKTTNYNVATTDNGALLVLNSASAATFTLLGTAPTTPWFIFVKNVGTGALTISRNGLTIDGKSANLTLFQGDGVLVSSDASNYWTGQPRSASLFVFMPGVGSNSQVLIYNKMDRPVIFPASAPNSFGVANTAATGSTTYTFKKNGSSFATAVFSASGTTAAFTQASDATFATGDILEIDGPATADATLANMGLTLQGYRF